MIKIINQKLGITPQQYEHMVWNLYSQWCQSVSITTHEYQQVLANSSVNRWFSMELTKCEKKFQILTFCYTNTNVTTVEFTNCFCDCVQPLFNIRPMALLSNIVKSKVKEIPTFNALNKN